MSAHLEYNIGTIPFQDDKWPCGVAYICLHADIDRDIFITDCFARATVSVKTKEGTVYKNCPVDISKFNDIVWPTDVEGIGSPVVYVTEPVHSQPIIISVLNFNDEIIDQEEHQFKLKRKWDNSIVEIAGSARDGYLNIIVDGVETSDFVVKISNANNNANLTVDIEGKAEILATDTITVKSQKEIITEVGIEDKVTTVTQNNSEVNNRVEKFSINDGSEPMTLGDTLKALLDEILDTVGAATVTTNSGPVPLNNAAKIMALKTKTQNILSQISFTD